MFWSVERILDEFFVRGELVDNLGLLDNRITFPIHRYAPLDI